MTNYLLISIAFLASALMSRIIIPEIIYTAAKKRLFDEPDERKIHAATVSRLAGFSFVPILLFSLALTLAAGYVFDSELLPVKPLSLLVCGLILLYLIGLKDDLVGARYRMKFSVQILAAALIPLSGLWINNLHGLFGLYTLSPWLGIPLTVFIIVFIINAINLIDGIDGLASGLSAISLLTLGIFFVFYNSWLYATIAFTMLGILIPFFYYNVFGQTEKNKKIFMGDAGSLTLGYVLSFLVIGLTVGDGNGSIAIAGYEISPQLSMIAAFSTVIVPAFDVCRVMLVRARNRQHIFMPDRNHIHHKFLKMGFSARKSLISILCMSLMFCTLNTGLAAVVNINLLLSINIALWVALHLVFNRMMSRNQENRSPKNPFSFTGASLFEVEHCGSKQA